MFMPTSYGHKETKMKLGPTDFLISLARLCHFNYTNSCNYGPINSKLYQCLYKQ